MKSFNKNAVVIGAGIAGLSAAWALKKKGYSVRILEKENRVGGVIQSKLESGFLWETGANETLLKSEEMENFFHEIGLGSELMEPSPKAKKRFIVKGGQAHEVPTGVFSFIKTPLFSLKGKIRLFFEPFVPRCPDESESVASFVSRRLGKDFLDYAIAPLLSGVSGGNAEKVSFAHQFNRLWVLEKRFGSLIMGTFKQAKERKKAGIKRYPYKLLSFRKGMQALPDRLGTLLADEIHTGVELLSIREKPWTVSWRKGEEHFEESFDRIVFAVPAYAYKNLPLPEKLSESVKKLDEVEYCRLSTVITGHKRDAVKHPLDGFGMLIPKQENHKILGSIFTSSLFAERCPESFVSLTSFVGGATHPELALLPDDEIMDLVKAELKQLLGIETKPDFVRITKWERAIPQYTTNYQEFLDCMDSVELSYDGLQFVGNIRCGAGVAEVCLNAIEHVSG